MIGLNFLRKSEGWGKPYSNSVSILLGVLSGAALVIMAPQGGKWFAAVILGLISFYSLFTIIIKYFKITFLFIAVFFISIRLDFQLFFKDTGYQQLTGLPVSMFDLAFILLLINWIYRLIRREESFRFFPSISLPAILYIFLSGLSAFLSEDKIFSFSMLILIIKTYFVFLYFANTIRTKVDILCIIIASLFGVLLQSLLGGMQFLTGSTMGLEMFGEGTRSVTIGQESISRVGGTIGDPNTLAMYLNFILPFLVAFLFTNIRLSAKIIVGFIILAGGVTEIMTLSRGGWMALGISTMVVLYGIFRIKFKSHFKSAFLVITIALLISGITLIVFSDVRARILESDQGSAYSRIPLFEVAFNIIKNNPLIGVGLNNYTVVMNQYDRTVWAISYKFSYPVHNAFLIIAAESGIPALACFLWMLINSFWKGLSFFSGHDRFLSFLGIGWVCGILTWVVHSMIKMSYIGLNIPLWLSIGVIIAIYRMLQETIRDNNPIPIRNIQ